PALHDDCAGDRAAADARQGKTRWGETGMSGEASQKIIDRGGRYRLKKRVGQGLFWLLLLVIVLYSVFPFYWAIVSSLKHSSALFTVEFWPKNPTIENYINVFKEQPFGRNILNSVFVSLVTVALCLFL